jgi:SRSO17 transposase
MTELREQIREDGAEPDSVVIIDPSAFPMKGTESYGIVRQWCGRLGKLENCQVGVFLAYASSKGYAPLDRRRYLPEEWASCAARRLKCHVPPEVTLQEKWQIALDLREHSLPGLPHGWITGDDEFGRVSQLRAILNHQSERYILGVPCNTTVHDLERSRPRRRQA